ncbi:MAG: hypothetical protein ACRDIB_17595, partial [Ardenticatenaceae bacterium]
MKQRGWRLVRLETTHSSRFKLCALVLTLLATFLLAAYNPVGVGASSAVFTVVNTNDAGAGSLRQAIQNANGAAGLDTIQFNIPGAGVHTITPLSPLPPITDMVVIDGLSQPGASCAAWPPTLLIELDGSMAGIGAPGLHVPGGSLSLRGVVINRFGTGVWLQTNLSLLQCNFIGTDVTGMAALGNTADGILVNGISGNWIGSPLLGGRNLISGNRGAGIHLSGAGAAGNLIQGNYIGTDVSGAAALPNLRDGIFVEGAADNLIGGTQVGTGNVISGNEENGIEIFGTSAIGNEVQGNRIGLNSAGTDRLGNRLNGVFVAHGSDNLIGGIPGGVSSPRNIISGNRQSGVVIGGAAAMGNLVQGNRIGTDSTGMNPVGNEEDGVVIASASGNTIGGLDSGAGNTIAHNRDEGVLLYVEPVGAPGGNPPGDGNAILRNAIHSNGALGIDLADDGVTPNDAGDGDTGPNQRQNFPRLVSVAVGATETSIQGTLNSTPNTTFHVEFFANDLCDPSGNGEGATYLGAGDVTTDAAGNASFDLPVPVLLAPGQFITATATDPDNNTSEFSRCLEVSLIRLRSVAIFLRAQPRGAGFLVFGADVVRDSSGQPVPGAAVEATWTLPGGMTQDVLA